MTFDKMNFLIGRLRTAIKFKSAPRQLELLEEISEETLRLEILFHRLKQHERRVLS